MGLHLCREARLIFDAGLAKVALCPSHWHCAFAARGLQGYTVCMAKRRKGDSMGATITVVAVAAAVVGGMVWIARSVGRGLGRAVGSGVAHAATQPTPPTNNSTGV